ncbi:MAG: hypothetical protein WC911_02485 [Thermoleophilia bacterium]
MRKFAVILIVLIVSSLGSPFASAAFAKEKPASEATVCVCPPECDHTTGEKCKHKCHKKSDESRETED